MKTCPRCGTSCADNDRFCPKCGNPLPEAATSGTAENPNNERSFQEDAGRSSRQARYEEPRCEQSSYREPLYQTGYRRPPRSIALAIILSIITCGIYALYWMVVLTDEINELTGDHAAPSGVVVLLLSVITCGIYGLYWAYVMGRKTAYLNGTADSGILNLIIALFGFQIVNMALFQDAANRYAG